MNARALLLLAFWILSSLAKPIQVNPKNQFFVDDQGRVRIFHGVNAVYKVPPWIPQTTGFDPQLSLSSEDITNLQKWGFNVVRLGMMWPGVEPVKGQYDTNYLKAMKQLVDDLGAAGIYTLLG
jgi:endoglycosylceramidase